MPSERSAVAWVCQVDSTISQHSRIRLFLARLFLASCIYLFFTVLRRAGASSKRRCHEPEKIEPFKPLPFFRASQGGNFSILGIWLVQLREAIPVFISFSRGT